MSFDEYIKTKSDDVQWRVVISNKIKKLVEQANLHKVNLKKLEAYNGVDKTNLFKLYEAIADLNNRVNKILKA